MMTSEDRETVRHEVATDLRRLANVLDEMGDDMPLNRNRVQVRYVVIEGDHAKAREHFEAINAALTVLTRDLVDFGIGSHEHHAEHYDDGVVHHTSTLHMGYGRVSYQALWIDRSEEVVDNA